MNKSIQDYIQYSAGDCVRRNVTHGINNSINRSVFCTLIDWGAEYAQESTNIYIIFSKHPVWSFVIETVDDMNER